MKTTHFFSIDFIIRRNKENKERALIYARITVDEERKEISIKESINASDWDSRSETVKGKSMQSKIVNGVIGDTRYKLKEKYRMLQDSAALITAESVKQAFLGEHTSQKGKKFLELLDYYRQIWENKLKKGGFKNYRTTIQYIKLFISTKFESGDMYSRN